jgi:hypothetical protein
MRSGPHPHMSRASAGRRNQRFAAREVDLADLATVWQPHLDGCAGVEVKVLSLPLVGVNRRRTTRRSDLLQNLDDSCSQCSAIRSRVHMMPGRKKIESLCATAHGRRRRCAGWWCGCDAAHFGLTEA